MCYIKQVSKQARFFFLTIILNIVVLLLVSLAHNIHGQSPVNPHSFFRVGKISHKKDGPDVVGITPMVSPYIIATIEGATANISEHDILECEQDFTASSFSDHRDKFIILKCGSGNNKQTLKIDDLFFGAFQ